MKKVKKIIKIVLISLVLLAIGLVLFALLRLPQIPDDLNKIALSSPTKIYADDGQQIKVLANRQVVPLDQISQSFINATLALEDNRFFVHHGFSKRGFIRAMLSNFKHGRVKQGGSTITQQLSKNLFFSFERSWLRKFQEFFVTLQIEQQFSKEKILEAYVNQIDFGSGIYGVELAAQTYFSKHADELTTAEASMLAGIPRWPYRYNPYNYPDIAKERQAFVLKRMFEEKYISEQEYQLALAEKLSYCRMYTLFRHADYFIDAVIKEASKEFGRNAVMYGGLDIYTTLKSTYQLAASQAVSEGLVELDNALGFDPYEQASWSDKEKYPQAALVALDAKTGAIKALMGGRDYQRAPFNRAVSNNRSPGSSFKLFTYLAAIDKNIVNPSTVMVDEPTQFRIYDQIWTPQNYDKIFRGPITLKMALAQSVNVIAAKVIEKVTPTTVIEYAQKMGISSPLEPHLSLALGATGVSPYEMAVAYSTVATLGIRREPFMIRQIFSLEKRLFENELQSKRVLDPQTCYILIDMLRGVIDESSGTGKSVRSRGFYRPCAGKTGTTNDYRDAWFIGFTPDLVTVVWVGFDDNQPMHTKWGTGVTGARAALPIWTIFMKKALKDVAYSDFPIPPGVEFKKINPVSGEEVTPYESGVPIAIRATGQIER